MEEKKNVFDYLAQVMVVFGFAMLAMNLFCLAFGASAREFSALFALGDQGIPAGIAFQFLGISALLTGYRFVFFTDTVIKKMPLWARTACMLGLTVITISAFILLFRWFPVSMWQPWAMFLLCFGLSFLGSCLVVSVKEKAENRRMEEALRRLQQKEGQRP